MGLGMDIQCNRDSGSFSSILRICYFAFSVCCLPKKEVLYSIVKLLISLCNQTKLHFKIFKDRYTIKDYAFKKKIK